MPVASFWLHGVRLRIYVQQRATSYQQQILIPASVFIASSLWLVPPRAKSQKFYRKEYKEIQRKEHEVFLYSLRKTWRTLRLNSTACRL
jgi:hypothetical protein